MPGTGAEALRLAVVLGGIATIAWYLAPRRPPLPSSRRQIRRDVAHAGPLGAGIYGAVLGVGWLTIVDTPLVWAGMVAVLLSGSTVWSALYGASFGSARFVHLLAQRLGHLGDSGDVVWRVVSTQRRALRVAALLVTPLIVAATLATHA